MILKDSPRGTELTTEDIQKILDERVSGRLVVGLAVGVITPNETQQYFAGTKRVGRDMPIDENTIFEIGSITKVFTTLLLALMDEEGLLKLSEPAKYLLPKGRTMPKRGGDSITLEHLATHTSGLPRLPSNMSPKDPENPYADYTLEQLYDFLAHHKLAWGKPGGRAEYSNLGMGLLGQLLSNRAQGQSYDALVTSRITKKLNMTSTSCYPNQTHQVARGHQNGHQVPAWEIPTLAGAGNLKSSLRDLMAFCAVNLGLQKSSLFNTLQRCHQERVDSANDPKELKVGLGWHIWKKYGTDIVWHNGGTGGFSTFLGFRKDIQKGVVVLSNSASPGTPDEIGLHLLNHLYPLPHFPTEIDIDPKILPDYVGTYCFWFWRKFTIKIEDDRLQVQLSGQDFYPVFPEAQDKFFYRVVEASITFERNDKGKVNRLILHQGGQDLSAKKRGYWSWC